MQDPQKIAEQLEQTFNNILVESMQGIPILNNKLHVQALGFHEHEGHILGIIITPWLMNVVLLPAEGEDWSNMQLGDKRPHEFHSRTYKFMLNEYDGIGLCQTHSLYSPMRDFVNQDQAIKVAQEFLADLKVDRELTEEELVDEELLGKVMRGEDALEVNLDDFDVIEPIQVDLQPKKVQTQLNTKGKKKISRRDFFRGNLS